MAWLRIDSTCVPGGFAIAPGGGVLGRVWVAASPVSRFVGLLATPDLDRSEVIVLVPCSAVHGIGLRMQVGVAFINGDGVVSHVVDPLPWWGARARDAVMVMEAASGVLDGVGAGDRIRFTDGPLFPHRGLFRRGRWGSRASRRALSGQRGHTVPGNDRRM